MPYLRLLLFGFAASLFSADFSAHAQFVDQEGVARIRLEGEDYGYFLDKLIWPHESTGQTVIFVCWEKSIRASFPKEVEWVRSAIAKSWEKYSRIQFKGWGECAAENEGIRITVAKTGPRVKEFGKSLDNVSGGMELNFTFERWSPSCRSTESERELCIRSIAVHEFGHGIGFAHEQDRADTPGECAALHYTGTTGSDLVQLTPYDPESVMNYCNPKYNNLGQLSARDIESVQLKYGAP